MKTPRILFAALSAILLVSTACKKVEKPDGMPELHPCVIKLTQDGAPLTDATIFCMSSDPKLIRWPVTGKTDENGVAKIFTMGKFEGAPLGTFAVVVTKEESDASETADGGDPMTQAYTPSDVYSLVELEFTAKETTPLSATVEAKKNEFEFDCGAKVRVLRSQEGI